jgi:hypothetical protein
MKADIFYCAELAAMLGAAIFIALRNSVTNAGGREHSESSTEKPVAKILNGAFGVSATVGVSSFVPFIESWRGRARRQIRREGGSESRFHAPAI